MRIFLFRNIAPLKENGVKISEEPPEKKKKRSEACSQLLRTAWSDDCNFSSTGGLKCLDCLKSFTDFVELLQHVHEDHHSFAADSNNTFDKNENIFVPNAILSGNEYDFGEYLEIMTRFQKNIFSL